MTFTRRTSLILLAVVAAACGESRGTNPATTMVTMPGGAADGSDVKVDANVCVRCHGDAARAAAVGDAAGVAFAPPVDVSRASTGPKVGAHLAHLRAGNLRASGVLCSSCHVVPANAGQHTPGVGLRDLAAVRLNGGPVITPQYAGGTCTNVYCHGAFNGGSNATVSWTGSTPACGSCHPIPPLVKTDGTSAHSTSTTCQSCHDGYTLSSVNKATHMDGQVQAAGCAGCHGDATRQNGDLVGVTYDPLQTASPPLDVKGNAASVTVGVHLAHVNPSASGVYKPIFCTECHPDNTVTSHPTDPTGNTQATVTFANATAADLAGYVPNRVLGNRTTNATTCTVYCHDGSALGAGYAGSVATWAWNGASVTCGSCHADPPTTLGHTSAGVTSTTNCGNCHPGYTATTVNVSLHINGQLDGGESNGGAACGSCHAPIFSAMNGTVAKSFKHALGAVAGTNDAANDAGLNWATVTNLTDNAAASRSCVQMCHGDHPHDLTSPVVATHENNTYEDGTTSTTRADGSATRVGPGGTGTVNRNRTDFDASATNGGLCASCHQKPIAAGRPTLDKAAFAASPHSLQATTNGTTNYSWEFRNHTTTGTANAFLRNCTKCHSSPTEGTTPTITVNSSGANSVHFSDNPAILAGKYNPAGAGTGGFVCFNCHGSTANPANGQQGDRSGVILQSRFAQASNHPVLSDALHDTNAETAAAYNDGTFKGANRHVNCLDCHAPHAAGDTLHAVGSNAIAANDPLNGQTGVTFTPPATNYATTGIGNFSANAGQPATLEYQVCFKCHSSFAFGATPPVGQSGLAETDVAQDFNPNNHSVHPVVGPNTYWPLNQAATRLGGQWTAGVGKTMYCADCHGSDTTAGAQGPHGSAATFILIGNGTTRTYWPTDSSGAYYQLGGTVTGLFCLNCHPNLNSTTSPQSNTLHRNSAHRGAGFACIDCHVRVPHGGKIPRLLITDTAGLPSRLKDPNAWATSGRTPVWSEGANTPKAWARSNTLTSDMGTSQCTACAQHTCNSGTYACEAW